MQIKNDTDRAVEVKVNAKSSETLWTTEIGSKTSQGKDFPDSEGPFTVLGRWKADPPLGFNFVVGGGHTVKNNTTVTISQTYPGFVSSP